MSRAGALLAPDDLRPADEGEERQLVLDEKAFPFAPLKALASEGALTAVGLDMTKGGDYTYAEYEKLGAYLGVMNRSCMWWIGDWLLYGEERFAERWSQALHSTGLAEQTLRNRMTVCKAIPITLRRVGLSFSIHAVVAGCKTAREMKMWLDRAERSGWNVDQLREAMRATRTTTDPPLAEPGAPVDTKLVVEAAEAVAAARKEYGSDYLVPREPMARLIGALGQEE